MSGYVLLWALLLAAVALVAGRLWGGRGARPGAGASVNQATYELRERAQMPAGIAHGELVFSEQTLRCERPRRLVARVDQVYRLPNGMLAPVDTKTRRRRRVTRYDQIELSVQATVLRNRHRDAVVDRAVAGEGWVRFAPPGERVSYAPVRLLPEAEVTQLHDHYLDLISGRVAPALVANRRHRANCPYCTAYLRERGRRGAEGGAAR